MILFDPREFEIIRNQILRNFSHSLLCPAQSFSQLSDLARAPRAQAASIDVAEREACRGTCVPQLEQTGRSEGIVQARISIDLNILFLYIIFLRVELICWDFFLEGWEVIKLSKDPR